MKQLNEIEKNGIKINLEVPSQVGREYEAEKAAIEKRLEAIVREVMGDTPINLNSGPDLVAVVYSRIVLDKNLWKATFNLGTDWRGKPLYPPRMKDTRFNKEVRANTKVAKRTTAMHCHECRGTGYIQRLKRMNTLQE